MFKATKSNIKSFYLFLYNRWADKFFLNAHTDATEFKFLLFYTHNYTRDFWSNVYVNDIIITNNFSKILQKKFKTKDKYGIVACIIIAKKLEENILKLLKLYNTN